MKPIAHQDMVRVLVKPGAEIRKNLGKDKLTLLASAAAIYVEAGKALEAVAVPNFCNAVRDEHESGLTEEDLNQWTDLVHAAVGIATEAGELLDAIKKLVVYNKNLDRENVIEELGDLEFYSEQWNQNPDGSRYYELDLIHAEMASIRSFISVTREQVLEANIAKLRVRYENLVYSDQAAHDRADKAPVDLMSPQG